MGCQGDAIIRSGVAAVGGRGQIRPAVRTTGHTAGLARCRCRTAHQPRERQVLEGRARRRQATQALAPRSRNVLAFADGDSVTEVAAELGTSPGTAGKRRSRFPEVPAGDAKRRTRGPVGPGRPPTSTSRSIARLVSTN